MEKRVEKIAQDVPTSSVDKSLLINFALSQGFNLVGFSPVKIDAAAYKHFESWVKENKFADMAYMSESERMKKRKSAEKLLKNAKTVICLAVNYYHEQLPLTHGHGRVARYAFGRDYHKILKKKLENIEDFIKENYKSSSSLKTSIPETLSYVDSGPLLERAFAVQAGLGFIGKNTTLITKEFGSWVLLAEIITNVGIKSARADSPQLSCGSCTRCIDACPTGAITRNSCPTSAVSLDPDSRYSIDARKCLSYWTIEYKGPLSKIPPKIRTALKSTHRLFGCDICQEACPHNCRAKPICANSKADSQNQIHTALQTPRLAGDSLDLKKISSINSDAEFLALFAGSPLTRTKLKGLKRNAKIIAN